MIQQSASFVPQFAASSITRLLWLIPAVPMLAAGIIALLKQPHRKLASSLATGSLGFSLFLSLIAFWRYGQHPEALTGMMFAIFSIAVAAAEAAVGLGLVIAIYRHTNTTELDKIDRMKG